MALNLGAETELTGDSNAARPEPLTPDELAPHFPQLEILECLGRGGMGVVYKARQKSLGRLVALKLLAPGREKDSQFAERFAREAQALAALNHPHIVTVHDFGETNGFFYLLMEFIDGVNLRQLLRSKKLTPEEALAIVPPVCDALQFAHERGVVHRDIKPENLLLAKDGRVKIADFGIATMLGAPAADQASAGTPGYMAPEQSATPPRSDSRADIYSLGVVIYEMLTGEMPTGKIEPPSRKVQIDVRLDEIVLRALEKNPELRWQTASELRTGVETMSAPAEPVATGPHQAKNFSPLALLGFLGFLGSVPHGERLWPFTGFFAFVALPHLARFYIGLRLPARRALWAGTLIAALALLTVFIWPHRELNPARTIENWTFGFSQPWVQEIKVYQPQMNNWSELHAGAGSLLAGVLSLVCFVALGGMQDAERGARDRPGGALVRLSDEVKGAHRIRWRGLLLAAFVILGAAINGVLLGCAVMLATVGDAPPVLLTIVLTAGWSLFPIIASLGVLRARNLEREGVKVPAGWARYFDTTPTGMRRARILLALALLVSLPMIITLSIRRTPPQAPMVAAPIAVPDASAPTPAVARPPDPPRGADQSAPVEAPPAGR